MRNCHFCLVGELWLKKRWFSFELGRDYQSIFDQLHSGLSSQPQSQPVTASDDSTSLNVAIVVSHLRPATVAAAKVNLVLSRILRSCTALSSKRRKTPQPTITRALLYSI